jgi:hypothetical protein
MTHIRTRSGLYLEQAPVMTGVLIRTGFETIYLTKEQCDEIEKILNKHLE